MKTVSQIIQKSRTKNKKHQAAVVVASKKERKVACTKLQNDDLARCPKKGGANCSDLFLISLESLNGTAIYSYKTIRHI